MEKRSRKGLITSVALLIILLAAVFLYWIRSPTYAIRELDRAIRGRDLATFYSRLDLNRIYDSGIDALTSQELADKDSLWDTLQANLTGGVTKVLKSQVMNQLKHDIEVQFMGSNSNGTTRPESSPIHEFFAEIEGIEFAEIVRTDQGALVNARFNLKKMGKNYPMLLRMEKEDWKSMWKITGFESLSSTLSQYRQDQVKKIEEHNREVRTELAALLPFFGQIRLDDPLLSLQKTVHLEFTLKNKSSSSLKSLKATLYVRNKDRTLIMTEPFVRENADVKEGEKKAFLLAKDIGLLNELKSESMSLEVVFEEAVFDDGKVLHLVKTYQEL